MGCCKHFILYFMLTCAMCVCKHITCREVYHYLVGGALTHAENMVTAFICYLEHFNVAGAAYQQKSELPMHRR